MIENKKIAFIGSGFMGRALVRGLLSDGSVTPENLTVSDPDDAALQKMADLKVNIQSDNSKAITGADVVVMCVKPQTMSNALADINLALTKEMVVISIAAGVTLSTLAEGTPSGTAVVRAMPNIGADVGASATALCLGGALDDQALEIAKDIFNVVGDTVVVKEELMDSVTGLSGSGPAYVFMFIEALIDAGVYNGLTREQASALAIETVYGAAKMAKQTGIHPALLKDRVTSPGGTTMAGLSRLEEEGFRTAIIKAVTEAKRRSEELGLK